MLGSRRLAFGKSQDGEGDVLLGTRTEALDQCRLSEFPGGAGARMPGCEPQKNKWQEPVREHAGVVRKLEACCAYVNNGAERM